VTFLEDRRGTAAIEFAIAMVPVVILLSGGITYAGVFSMRIALQNAANEGVRSGIAGTTLCEREALATTAARAALTLGHATEAEVSAHATADKLTVTISYPYGRGALTPVMMPVPDRLSATAVTLTDEPIMPPSAC
jgi:Flp pilus assembly protein TadG